MSISDLEREQNKRDLQQIEIKTKGNIEIDGTSERTIKAYQQAFTEKGLVIEQEKDYPRDQFMQLKYLKEFDSRVDPSKGISKKIVSMVRQPVNVVEKGKRVTKDALYFYGNYGGSNYADITLRGAEFKHGYYLKPKLGFALTDSRNPFDPQTGQKRGTWAVQGHTYEHYIFLSEDKKERRKFLESLLEKYPDTTPEDLAYGGHLAVRQASPNNDHSGSHGGNFKWNQFCDLSLSELLECQDKNYYKDEKGTLRDKDGVMAEYNRSTGKIEAIK